MYSCAYKSVVLERVTKLRVTVRKESKALFESLSPSPKCPACRHSAHRDVARPIPFLTSGFRHSLLEKADQRAICHWNDDTEQINDTVLRSGLFNNLFKKALIISINMRDAIGSRFYIEVNQGFSGGNNIVLCYS